MFILTHTNRHFITKQKSVFTFNKVCSSVNAQSKITSHVRTFCSSNADMGSNQIQAIKHLCIKIHLIIIS